MPSHSEFWGLTVPRYVTRHSDDTLPLLIICIKAPHVRAFLSLYFVPDFSPWLPAPF